MKSKNNGQSVGWFYFKRVYENVRTWLDVLALKGKEFNLTHSLILCFLNENFIILSCSFYVSYNTIKRQNIDARIRKININLAFSLPHKLSAL